MHGIGNVNKWIENNTIKSDGSDIENIPYKETRNYVRKVERDYRIYQQIAEWRILGIVDAPFFPIFKNGKKGVSIILKKKEGGKWIQDIVQLKKLV